MYVVYNVHVNLYAKKKNKAVFFSYFYNKGKNYTCTMYVGKIHTNIH